MFPPKSLVLLSIFSVALGENQTVPRSGVPLITAGSDTHNRDYSKHIASIRLGKPKWLWGDNFQCGCTFIAPDMVLTAAHCIINETTDLPIKPRYLTVVAGSVNRFHQTKDTVELKVRQVIVHCEYSVETSEHDIGILKLEKRATILFPNSAEILSINLSPVEPDTICTVMGWGWIFTGGIDSPILLYANVTVMSQFQCFRDHFEKSPSWGVICAGGEEDSPRHLDRDACNGDSGGPLVCNGMLAGIVSFGTHDECGKSGKPGGYTDVYYYRRWIKANSPESFPESSARSNVPAPIVVMFTMFLLKL